MKIAVNTRLLVPDKMDGIARFAYETLQLITRAHPEIQFTFIFDRTVEENAFQFPENVTFVTIPPPARHPILWFIWFEISVKRYINQNNFDLFLSPEGWIPPRLNCKSLAVIHDLNFEHHPENIIWSHRKYLLYFFPKFAQRATRIATVSEYSKQDIASTYHIPTTQIDVVYNGANEVFEPTLETKKLEFKERYTSKNDFFIFIGTIHPRKNLEHLLLAFEEFKTRAASETKLLIVGNKKWWPTELEKTYQSMTYKEDVCFMGRLSDEELSVALSSALALTYLPYFEGFGIPILEAFQTETAVITSNVTSMPEVAADAAILCDPKKVSQIADAMLLIANQSEKRTDLIEKGKLRKQDFSWEKSANLLWNSIEKTLKN
ncbi:MAG: glycosyltransferase involved in cell wall biosynthesis [Vicingaceae bacterium]|jgi:glycosyltransferase involved in cell wall biosynthesis